jgi:hypothetical protein
MIENKNVYFKAVGMPLDKYVPRARYSFVDGKRGDGWVKDLFPKLQMDIAIAPLDHNIFNNGKSNIKWQEATRAGACFVASKYGPYSDLTNGVALLVENDEESWYRAFKQLIDKTQRQNMLKKAQKELEKCTLANNWEKYEEMFKKVKEYKDANYTK